MAGIVLEISVDDKGTPKIKQFSDEAKKAFKEMTEAPRQAQGALTSLRDSWVGLTAKFAVATAAFYASKKIFYDMGREIASAADEIERQSRLVGISTDEWQKWQYAAKMADVESQEFSIGLKLLSRNMEDASQGSGDAAKYFSAMGVAVKDSAGHLRPLNDVMLDIADKFSAWEDGPRKIAISLALFGRSGESIAPMLNKGREGIQGLMEEAGKLNTVLGKDTIMALSEAEESFKKWEITWKIAKAETFGPMLKAFTHILDRIREMRSAWREGGIKGVYEDVLRAQEEQRVNVLETPGWVKEWVSTYKGTAKAKPPTIGGAYEEIEKDVLIFRQLVAEAERLSEFGGMPDWREFIEYTPKRALPDLIQLDLELNKLVAEAERLSEFGDMPDWREFIEYTPKRALPDIIQLNLELNKLIAEAENLSNKGKMPSWLDALEESMGIGQAQWRKSITEMDTIWNSFAQNISSVWSENVTGMIKGTEKFSDAFKNLIKGIGDTFISTVSKMITQWLLFGSITGGTGGTSFFGKSKSGYGGILGGILGLLGLQEGGIVTRPTPALIGEGGPEAVVPLKSGRIPVESKEPTIQITNHIWTNDVDSFRRYLLANRDLLEGISIGAYSDAKRLNKAIMR